MLITERAETRDMALDHDPDSLGLTNNTTQSTPGDDTRHVVTAHVEQINVFFDGTGNNYFNTAATPEEQRTKRHDSYGNDLTNVARMWQALKKSGEGTVVYVEGIATTQKRPDSVYGKITGDGEAGIVERVQSVFPKIQEKYKRDHPDEDGVPALFDVNVFGFSRGAAAARYFLYLLRHEKNRHFTGQWQKPVMRVNFVGLFDCVAHYGWVQFNDVKNLNLKFEADFAYKVFHLIAGDEYRANFNLTNIQSAVDLKVETCDGLGEPMGRELRIPGAHADVGGSYNSLENETHCFADLMSYARHNSDPGMRMEMDGGGYTAASKVHHQNWPTLEDWAVDKGWYTHDDCHRNPRGGIYHRQVNGDSYKVALTLMVAQANQHSRNLFQDAMLLTTAPSAPLLKRLHSELSEFALNEKNTEWKLEEKWSENDAKALRRHYLHLSFNNKTGMPPRLNPQGWPEREVLPG